MEEILLVDKPVGITSFDVIRRLRKELGIKKMGHAGTLDPRASGLMIIGVGTGTKKLTEYIKLPKEYVTEILLGESRSTGDMEGEVLEEKDVPEISKEEIEETLQSMVGTLTLPVSLYSAIKKDGVPMYKRARKGETVEAPIRDMEVTEAEYLSHSCSGTRCVVQVRFAVGSGTYIRSLGEEFGKRLGYPAVLQSLRRTKVGEFDIKNAREV
ncbi:tRNA pseudouridine(55) synthase TruB [Candidatus Kaiserbacteria bacterium]|nr:tRNA pseudouridine(55) synthase TruB [Candidatus Kaiserbacteria bacterium]